MKVLFFHAAASNPRVAAALAGQAAATLRPFNQFLGQAIHTAKDRQYRYALPWERVRNLLTFPWNLWTPFCGYLVDLPESWSPTGRRAKSPTSRSEDLSRTATCSFM